MLTIPYHHAISQPDSCGGSRYSGRREGRTDLGISCFQARAGISADMALRLRRREHHCCRHAIRWCVRLPRRRRRARHRGEDQRKKARSCGDFPFFLLLPPFPRHGRTHPRDVTSLMSNAPKVTPSPTPKQHSEHQQTQATTKPCVWWVARFSFVRVRCRGTCPHIRKEKNPFVRCCYLCGAATAREAE